MDKIFWTKKYANYEELKYKRQVNFYHALHHGRVYLAKVSTEIGMYNSPNTFDNLLIGLSTKSFDIQL